jgi:nitrite reductase (NO-forming)
MTDLLARTDYAKGEGAEQGAHTHPGLIMIAIGGLILAAIAAAIGVGAVMITPDEADVAAASNTAAGGETSGEAGDADPGESDQAAATGVFAGAFDDVVGEFVPKDQLPAVPGDEINVSYAPDVPPPSGRTEPAIIDVHFEIVENVVEIDPARGVEYETWGYRLVGDGSEVHIGTPGPMIRGQVGDVLRFTITNPDGNTHPHNVDFHAVTGQGGGAAATTVAPGETTTIEARLIYPGFYMYHCAYGDVPLHISHGMFGGILVDPEVPLPKVDHEWYVVQSEYYTDADEEGLVGTDRESITNEEPTFVVFNGTRGALTGDNALGMQVGERARFYFVNAGLNLTSNFHPIGSHWDTVYQEASLLSPPIRGSQTTVVPAGGGTVVELIGQVPSTIILVDHALSRTFDKGAIGQVVVEGEPNPEIFEHVDAAGDGAATDGGDTDGSAGDTVDVGILVGSGNTAPTDAPDEFAEEETPGDYSINVLEIPVGTTVTWTNQDSVIHTVTAVDESFASGFMREGETWSYTFEEPGEFEYLCTPHPWMRARVIVTG